VVKKRVYEIDGAEFSSLEGFYEEISRKLVPDATCGRNLDAFNDILRGGFGTPRGGFVLEWKNSKISKERLGYDETIRQLGARLLKCHSESRMRVAQEIADAEKHQGETVFDWLVQIIRKHCAGGAEQVDGVELELC
jgi:RNAse (barnase) inhibitor barstar